MLLYDFSELNEGVTSIDIFGAVRRQTDLMHQMGVLNNFVVDANNPETDGDQLSLSRFLKAWTFPSIYDVWNLLCNISTTILVGYVFLYALNRLRLHVASKTQNSRQVQYVATIFKRKKRLSLTEGEGERQQQESLLP